MRFYAPMHSPRNDPGTTFRRSRPLQFAFPLSGLWWFMATAMVAAHDPAWAAGQQGKQNPVTLYADQIHGVGSDKWTASGNVEVLYGNRRLYADQVHYDQKKDEIVALGHVRLVSRALVTVAPEARLKIRVSQAVVFHPRYLFPGQGGFGHALIGRESSRGHYRLDEACYTTCHGQVPAWQLRTEQLYLNQKTQYVTTRDTTLNVFGLPVFWLPYLSFPLKRHSGFLPPVVGSSTINGFNLGIPYYFDIASNLDDTVTISGYTKRGVMVQNEFRYLEPQYSGRFFLDLLPADRLTRSTVWAVSWQHQQNLGDGIALDINYNRVSYNNFLSDFAGVAGFSGGYVGGIGNVPYLTSTAGLYYGSRHIQAGAVLQGYQELLPGNAAPYSQLPYLYANGYWRLGSRGYLDWRSGFNYFYASSGPMGQRLDITPTLGWKFSRAWGFLEPQARIYYSHYQIQRNGRSYSRAINRTLPAMSIRGALNFIRYGTRGGSILIQPIFKYLYIPLQSQSSIPLFDSSQPFQNFLSIFSDNSLYDGADRINSANQLAYGLKGAGYGSKGREIWEAAMGQIQHFNRYQISLAGNVIPQASRSSYFWQATYAPAANFQLAAGSETSANWKRFERLDFRAQWFPAKGSVLNLDYRYTRGFVNQAGISAGFPIFRNWRLLGSYQYDVTDDKPLEQLAGIGYDGGCWSAQLIMYHQILLGGQSNNAVYLEILLRGLTSVGNSSNSILNQYVPGASMEF